MGSVIYIAVLHVFPASANMMPTMETAGTTRFRKRIFLIYAGFSVDSVSRLPLVAYHHWRERPVPITRRFDSNTIAPTGTPEKAPEKDDEKGRSATNMSVTRLIQVNILSGVRTEWNCMCWLSQNAPRIRNARA